MVMIDLLLQFVLPVYFCIAGIAYFGHIQLMQGKLSAFLFIIGFPVAVIVALFLYIGERGIKDG